MANDALDRAMADACLASWLTPSELRSRHDRGYHDLCPVGWCEHVTQPTDHGGGA